MKRYRAIELLTRVDTGVSLRFAHGLFREGLAMAVGLAITRHDESADDLRRVARSCRNVAQARRLLTIALVMEGRSRTDAATAAGMDRPSLRDWVHRLNAEGPDGLRDKPRSGRPARLSEDQLQVLDAIVEAGPDLETDGVCGGAARTCNGSSLMSTASPFASVRSAAF